MAAEKRSDSDGERRRFEASMSERRKCLVQELISDLRKTLSDDKIAAGMEFLRRSVSFF
jgi:hypothetical protein